MAMEPTDRNGLSAETRDLIAAVLETLDIPYAATVAHEETRARILDQRIMQMKVSLQHLAEAADRGDRFMGERFADGLTYLRERLAEMPPTGYVTADQARARCDAGATWTEAVSLDYDGPDGDEGDVPASNEVEQDGPDEDDKDARVRRVAENVLYLARRGPAVQQLADANRAEGRTGVADALDAVADAHDRLADAVDYDGDWIAAVEDIRDASARVGEAIAAARAQEGADEPPLVTDEGASGGFLIPPPADPAERAEWENGAAAREAAGLSGFVGEDYPNGGRR